MDNLHPLLLMDKTEERLLRKLFRQIDGGNKREQASSQLADLSAAALEREIGLKKYMVIRVERDDGLTLQLQALSFSITCFRGYMGGWSVRGRIIRKDGSLGLLDKGLAFRHASISRRLLDGSWVNLGLGRDK